ncbi:hypothetical protein B277_03905 [Janibacter hoylei PVAS-1]|uniref:Uncharacterized protein n=1 Tax=Janibacter hoylei PVAS-1 TaxID=1210046 RepID=K1E521_9MICO|nr:hypothetical protein [Janibacter hoylei]EKA62161.1 hypothetical protein B277_03905 [Janibacter hoylei PVAS-1]RWU85115.1 hypothetical protein CWN80_02910 [Janibacter hoylei PVAS-1]
MGRDDALSRWWSDLTTEQQATARAMRAGDSMPSYMLRTLTHAGIPQAAAWWPASESGPTFTVPEEVVRFVAEQR